MAIDPESAFPGKITASSAEYPFGKARNITTPGDGTGTPWDQLILNDIFGFQQALLSEAGVVPSGSPDEVGASQYLDALRKITMASFATKALMAAQDSENLTEGQLVFMVSRSTVGDGAGGEFRVTKTDISADVTADTEQGAFVPFDSDVTGASGGFIRNMGFMVSVLWFGAKGDGTTNDTVSIQAAANYVIANANLSNLLWLPSPAIYLIDNVTCKSNLPIEFSAYGAYLKLNASGSAGIIFQGAAHNWRGGNFVSASGLITHLARAFDLTQVAGFVQNNGSTIEDVDIIDVYQGVNAFMDATAFPANTNFRHRVINCFIRNTTNGTKTWAGSFGVKFDGTTANNSAGNDSKVIGGLIAGFETGLFTNGEQTNTSFLSIDACKHAHELDGAHYFNQIGGYEEFNDFNFKYTNSPTDTQSSEVSFSTQTVGFATGVHGTGGSFGKHLFINCIGDGATLNQLVDTNHSTNTGIAIRSNVTGIGKQYQAKNASGTTVFEIDVEGLISAGNPAGLGVNDFSKNVPNDAGNVVCFIRGQTSNAVQFFATAGGLGNAANTTILLPRDSVTNRSINAGGTINASGADYAEYMTKADGCGNIAKGDICGVDQNGNLTDKYDGAHSFVIKSTDPSYVGGDVWGKDENGLDLIRPNEPVIEYPEQEPEEQDEVYTVRMSELKAVFLDSEKYRSFLDDLSTFESALEVARQKVDRIAFSGQVPINMTGASVADYIHASRTTEGGIEAVVGEYTPDAVGKVWTILEDGRPLVKVL